jgi:hypothetical protein
MMGQRASGASRSYLRDAVTRAESPGCEERFQLAAHQDILDGTGSVFAFQAGEDSVMRRAAQRRGADLNDCGKLHAHRPVGKGGRGSPP